jgi:hypothetical protein
MAMGLLDALEDLQRKVKAIRYESTVTQVPDILESGICSASTTLNLAVALSCQSRTKRRITNMLHARKRGCSDNPESMAQGFVRER